jgi:hypothetical protein
MKLKRQRPWRGLTMYRQIRAHNAQRMRQIVQAVSLASGIDVPTLKSHYVATTYVDARFAAIRLGRRHCISFPQMGGALGGRDHTTILSGLKRAAEIIETDPVRGKRILAIEREAERIIKGLPPPQQVAVPAKPQMKPPVQEIAVQRRHGRVNDRGEIICDP